SVSAPSRGDSMSRSARCSFAAGLLALFAAACSTSKSSPVACPSSQVTCNGGTSCVDLSNDVANCGGCNHVCANAVGGSATCVNGQCLPVCTAPFQPCRGTVDVGVANYTCVDTSKDTGNCGGCGGQPAATDHICLPQQNCVAGQCTNCPAGQIQ